MINDTMSSLIRIHNYIYVYFKCLGRGRMDDLNEDFGVVSLLDRLNLAHSQEEDSAVDLDIFALVGGLNPAVG